MAQGNGRAYQGLSFPSMIHTAAPRTGRLGRLSKIELGILKQAVNSAPTVWRAAGRRAWKVRIASLTLSQGYIVLCTRLYNDKVKPLKKILQMGRSQTIVQCTKAHKQYQQSITPSSTQKGDAGHCCGLCLPAPPQ